MSQTNATLSVVIPTYNRGEVLLNTLNALLQQSSMPMSIIVVDQTQYATDDPVFLMLKEWHKKDKINWLRLPEPSIPKAMNQGLLLAKSDYVLFLDDDIEIADDFITQHQLAISSYDGPAHVGQVIQPWQKAEDVKYDPVLKGLDQDLNFPFHSTRQAEIINCMAGNLCVNRQQAIGAGGFDEHFVGAAYRFETEFCRRLCRYAKQPFQFKPEASLYHLHLSSGGTRAKMKTHLTSRSSFHSSGDYYFALREGEGANCLIYILARFFGSVKAKFYLKQPWWVPVRLLGEFNGLVDAIKRYRSLPRYINVTNNTD